MDSEKLAHGFEVLQRAPWFSSDQFNIERAYIWSEVVFEAQPCSRTVRLLELQWESLAAPK